jgi:hypothetical protein
MPRKDALERVHVRQRVCTSFRATRGLRHQKRIRGFPRKFDVHMKASAQLYLGLKQAAKLESVVWDV